MNTLTDQLNNNIVYFIKVDPFCVRVFGEQNNNLDWKKEKKIKNLPFLSLTHKINVST